jgi:hypothetical protein
LPQVCTFYGITIYIYYDDHPDPHFHAFYGGREVMVAITDLRAMDGAITPRAMGLVVEWASRNFGALMEDWALAEQHLPLRKMAPLK